MLNTYNSKTNLYGERLNLVINDTTNELYFHTCNVFDKGNVFNDLGIREVKRLYKEFINGGYKEVSYKVAKQWE